jgi:starch-binding outer membrane protein, SusD/RagB family
VIKRTVDRTRHLGVCVAMALIVVGCDDFITVEFPTVIDGGTIDPAEDASLLSHSVFQNFAVAYGDLSVYSAFLNSELWLDDTGTAITQVPRRAISPFTNEAPWASLSRALATAEGAAEILRDIPGADLARVLIASGYSLQMMAEIYCAGVVRGGPLLTTENVLELAQERFEEAVAVAGTLAGTDRELFHGAAYVGLARAYLQAGRTGDAVAAAAAVAEGFVFEIPTSSDPGQRDRLGNRIYDQAAGRHSQVVPPAYVGMADAGDPRIPYRDAGRNAQGGWLRLYEQTKFDGWDSPYQLASKLEARYIEMEARQDPDEMLVFINERRAAGNQDEFAGGTLQELLAELLDQKSRDFWIEGGKRQGDWRRHPELIPNVLPAGGEFYKPGFEPVGDQVCFPIPAAETENNPNIN